MVDDKDNCVCGHPLSVHTRDVLHEQAKGEFASFVHQKPYDIYSDRPAGESGCTECDCRQWKPVNYSS